MASLSIDGTFSKPGLPKGLALAHLNICSLRNKTHELSAKLMDNGIHVMAITETHLDSTFDDSLISIEGFSMFRKDRNRFGGGVAIYVKHHIPVKLRPDLMNEH